MVGLLIPLVPLIVGVVSSGPFWVLNCFSVDSEVDSDCPIFLIAELLKSTHAYGLSTYAVLNPGEKLDKVDD